MIASDLHARLVAALPPEIPVLLPAQQFTPAEWQELDADEDLVSADERGLHVYLRQRAPRGYVQLAHSSGLLSNGIKDTGMVQLQCIASDVNAATALSQLVRQMIGSTPIRPTPYLVLMPPTTAEDAVSARVTTTYQTNTLGV